MCPRIVAKKVMHRCFGAPNRIRRLLDCSTSPTWMLSLGFYFKRTGCTQTSADLTAETFAAGYFARRRVRPGLLRLGPGHLR